jgi:hypothetical protein
MPPNHSQAARLKRNEPRPGPAAQFLLYEDYFLPPDRQSRHQPLLSRTQMYDLRTTGHDILTGEIDPALGPARW